MQETNDRAGQLIDILKREIAAISNHYACQKRMYEYVLVRDWVSLEREMAEAHSHSNLFLRLDEGRSSLLAAIAPDIDESRDFYRITASFPDAERVEANALYRDLKRLLLLSKTENEVFNTYVTNARPYLHQMLDAVVPAKKGKIYSRKGALIPGAVDSLVVNRSF